MLSKEVFNAQVERLVNEYADKGMNMPLKRTEQWYERFQKISDADFKSIVDEVLDTCSHTPVMADMVKTQAYEAARENPRALKKLEGTR